MLWIALTVVASVSVFPANAGPSGPITWGSSVNIGGGWGRMIQLTNGHWLCVTASYPSGTNSFLQISRSTDQARTWVPLSQVKEDGRTLDNGELIVLPDGTILLTMRSLIPDVSYKLPVYASVNNGATWTYRSNIDTSEGLGAKGLWEPDFWVLADGRLMVTYSNEKHPGYSQLISQRVSSNNGFTWGPETWPVSPPQDSNLRPGMSQVALMANGHYILVYEIVNLGNADVYCKTSPDGTNWPAGLGKPIPCQHCGPFVTSLPNGLVLVSSCENQVSFSEDFGETWQKTDPPPWDLGFRFTWPAIYSIPTNRVGVMVVSNGVKLRFGDVNPRLAWPNPFTENFDDNADDGWTHYDGNFGFDSGRYLLRNEGTNGKALAGDVFWTDGTLEADLRLTSPGNAGIIYRTTNPDYTGPDAFSGYYAGLDTSGRVLLGRMNNSWIPLTNRPVPVNTNAWYRLKITAQGSSMGVFLNNIPQFTWTDTNCLRGQIGVRAFQCDAEFDNITYSNAAPLRLKIQKKGERVSLNWPMTSATVKVVGHTNLSAPDDARPITEPASFSGSEWVVQIESSGEPARYFWLEGQ